MRRVRPRREGLGTGSLLRILRHCYAFPGYGGLLRCSGGNPHSGGRTDRSRSCRASRSLSSQTNRAELKRIAFRRCGPGVSATALAHPQAHDFRRRAFGHANRLDHRHWKIAMTIFVPGPTSRRAFLAGVTGLVVAARIPHVAAEDSKPVKEFKLTATAGRVALVGKPHPDTNVWCYDGRVPGPEVRLQQGEPVRIIVQNNLTEGTTVHWHGIRLPIAMDGVPGISQPLIRPGERFVYEFTPPDAGTFWYHPHADSLQQLGRGMAGALIVEEPQPLPV